MKKFFGKNSGNTNKVVAFLTSVKFIVTVAACFAVAAFLGWQYHQTSNPDKLFWGMIDNNLQTSSFSRTSTQKSGGQSATQVVDVTTIPNQIVYSRTTFVQTGPDEAQAVTENIGTPKKDYVRYTSITTSQKNAEGKDYDFSKVLGVWGESIANSETETGGQLYNQSVLGVVPVGNLTLQQRKELVNLMKKENVYEYKVTKTERDYIGRPTYTLNVVLTPKAYVTVLKQYAKTVGLNQFEAINPDDYKKAAKQSFQVTIDGWSHQATSIVQGTGKPETINGRNARKLSPAVPKQTIGIDELQSRLQSIE